MLPKEATEMVSEVEVILRESVQAGANLVAAGAEIPRGTVVLRPGRQLGPTQLALLAALGKESVLTYRPPSLRVISTGDELVEPGRPLGPGQIHECNGIMLEMRCRELGVQVAPRELVGDDPQAIRRLLESAGEDILVWTGGVSAGDYDHLPRTIAEAGYEIVFHRVRIKPGKPVLLARRGDGLIFGLPGNPVSAAVTFELFVRTAIRRWAGFAAAALPEIRASLAEPVSQRPGRRFFRPATLEVAAAGGWQVRPTGWVSSADLRAYAAADCLIQIPEEESALPAGAPVRVCVLDAFAGNLGDRLVPPDGASVESGLTGGAEVP